MSKELSRYPSSGFSQQEVARYYDVNTLFYRLLWHGKSLGIHHGFYDEGIQTHDQAILRVNEVLADIGNICSVDRVLDAGCGVGGSTIWLAKNIGCEVVGLTISDKQIKKANQNKRREGVSDLVHFLKRDFSQTEFEAESFDVVWAIESICHAQDKQVVIKEMHRVLKPGGRIVISDWFKTKENMAEEERDLLNKFIHGFSVPSVETPASFRSILAEVGFENILQIDRGGDIKRNLEYGMPKARKLGLVAHVLPVLIPYFKEVARNYFGALAEEKAYQRGLWTIQIVYAEKPQ